MTDEQKMKWPGWETIQLIGRGSFGEVYEIRRDVFGDIEKAALKVISIPQNESDIDELYSDGYDEESITLTFQNHLKSIVAEYSLMRKLNGCANVVHCDDIRYVQHDNGFGWNIYIKMELLTPLTKALPAKVSDEMVVKLGKDMCTALELCRKHGIIHRDIKPQNIFVSDNNTYKLGDFGIAKTVEKTMGGTKIGTYKYMAPEVYNNKPYGTSADIYSLGLVMYWLLNERRMPFMPLPPEKPTAGMEEGARHRRFIGEQLPPPAHGSESLKKIVLKACAYDPKDRYATAEEMLRDLNEGFDTAAEQRRKEAEEQRRMQEEQARQRKVAEERERLWKEAEEQARLQREQEEQARIRRESAERAYAAQRQKATIEQNCLNTEHSDKQERRRKKVLTMVAIGLVATFIVVLTMLVLVLMKNIGGFELLPKWGGPESCDHNWRHSTCEEPRICEECGETQGQPLGHNWVPATCGVPETCANCGQTRGQAPVHSWTDVSCAAPATCINCGQTQGQALPHTWEEASFVAPKTCIVCGATEGSHLPYETIDVGAEITRIREAYYEIHDMEKAGEITREKVRHGVYFYSDDKGTVHRVVVSKGINTLEELSDKYYRSYYFVDGELAFVFYEGSDSHRIYFIDGHMMRWIYRKSEKNSGDSEVETFTFSEEYMHIEELVLAEVESFGMGQ